MIEELAHIDTPAPTATTVDRIKYLIRISRRTQAQFAELIGVDPSHVSKVLSGRLPAGESFLNRMVVNLGVSKRWLVDGSDMPFPRGAESGSHNNTPAADTRRGAPVYNIDVTAGCTELSRMFTDERILGYLDLPNVDPSYPIVKVTGDSMSPKIENGSFISIRRVSNDSPICWGQIYVVILEDYRLVKYVRRNTDPSKVTLHSANPEYDDMEVRRDQILGLYLVETVINYDTIS